MHVYNHGGSRARARNKLILDADGSCANFVHIFIKDTRWANELKI